jgi:hypothetical protein
VPAGDGPRVNYVHISANERREFECNYVVGRGRVMNRGVYY